MAVGFFYNALQIGALVCGSDTTAYATTEFDDSVHPKVQGCHEIRMPAHGMKQLPEKPCANAVTGVVMHPACVIG